MTINQRRLLDIGLFMLGSLSFLVSQAFLKEIIDISGVGWYFLMSIVIGGLTLGCMWKVDQNSYTHSFFAYPNAQEQTESLSFSEASEFQHNEETYLRSPEFTRDNYI